MTSQTLDPALTLLALVLVIGISYLGATRIKLDQRVPQGFVYFFRSGALFLFVGVALGPWGSRLLNAAVINETVPLLECLLSWIGLYFGAQFKFKWVRSIPFRFYASSFLQSLVSFLIITLGLSFMLWLFKSPNAEPMSWLVVLVLGVLGSQSSPALLTLISRHKHRKSPTIDYLRFLGSTDGIWGIVAMGVLLCFFQQSPSLYGQWLNAYGWIAFNIFLGLFLGFLFRFLILLPASENERFALLLGMVTFTGGLAYFMHLSTLFLNFLVGVNLANHMHSQKWLDKQLGKAERPFYFILLVFLGALWRIPNWQEFLLITGLVIWRTLGKTLGVFGAIRLSKISDANPWRLGGTLLDQGGLPIALACSFYIVFGGEVGLLILTSILWSFMIQGGMGTRMILSYLKHSEAPS